MLPSNGKECLAISKEHRENFIVRVQGFLEAFSDVVFKKILSPEKQRQFKEDGIVPEDLISLLLAKEGGAEFLAGYQRLSEPVLTTVKHSFSELPPRIKAGPKSEEGLVPKEKAVEVRSRIKKIGGGISSKQLANILGVSLNTIHGITSGKSRLYLLQVGYLARKFGFDESSFFEKVGIPELWENFQKVTAIGISEGAKIGSSDEIALRNSLFSEIKKISSNYDIPNEMCVQYQKMHSNRIEINYGDLLSVSGASSNDYSWEKEEEGYESSKEAILVAIGNLFKTLKEMKEGIAHLNKLKKLEAGKMATAEGVSQVSFISKVAIYEEAKKEMGNFLTSEKQKEQKRGCLDSGINHAAILAALSAGKSPAKLQKGVFIGFLMGYFHPDEITLSECEKFICIGRNGERVFNFDISKIPF